MAINYWLATSSFSYHYRIVRPEPQSMPKDISESEEAHLPLPDGWIKILRVNSGIVYKDAVTNNESDEHPFILEALNAARKLKLPVGWAVKEAMLEDGTYDYYYANAELGISLRQPPLLRHCLADILGSHGHSAAASMILSENEAFFESSQSVTSYDSPPTDNNDMQAGSDSTVDMSISNHLFFNTPSPSSPTVAAPWNPSKPFLENAWNGVRINYSATASNNNVANGKLNRSSNNNSNNKNKNNKNINKSNNKNNNSVCLGDSASSNCLEEQLEYVERWEVRAIKEKETDNGREIISKVSVAKAKKSISSIATPFISKNSYDTRNEPSSKQKKCISPPNKSESGIRALKSDCQSANVRIHELLVRLRASLCEQSNVPFKIIDSFQDITSNNNYSGKTLLRQAAAIISQLFCNPDRLVSMLANVLKPSDSALVYAVFIILHRLLHPLSSDNSLTSAFVLKTLNFQIKEIGQINEIFPDSNESRSILARALFIKDPETAFNWDPLAQPLPVFPNLAEETLLASVLRVYSIRRDVTSYFRTTWRPALPSVLSLLSSPKDMSGRDIFINLVTSAFRILECTFSEQAIMAFPVTATAVCRSLYEIGGSDALHFYMLNFLVLPNLLKILTGDHESIENEITYNKSTLNEMLNAYFDFNAWWPSDNSASTNVLIWLVWRIYSCAILLESSAIDNITTSGLFRTGLMFDFNLIPDPRLRDSIRRMRKKIKQSCQKILKLPLDEVGSEFLGESQSRALKRLKEDSLDNAKAMEYRLMALFAKPEEMMSFTLITQRELTFLLHNVGVDLELSKVASNSELYRSISEYLIVNEYVEEDHRCSDIDFLVVPFMIENINETLSYSEKVEPELDYVQERELLTRGMKFLSRYEDVLLRMLEVVESKVNNRIDCILAESKCFIAPEFKTNLDVKTDKVVNRNVSNSQLSAFINSSAFIPGYTGLKETQVNIEKNFRFASPSDSIHTSFARPILPRSPSPVSINASLTRPILPRSPSSAGKDARHTSPHNAVFQPVKKTYKPAISPLKGFQSPTRSSIIYRDDEEKYGARGRPTSFVDSLRSPSRGSIGGTADGKSARRGTRASFISPMVEIFPEKLKSKLRYDSSVENGINEGECKNELSAYINGNETRSSSSNSSSSQFFTSDIRHANNDVPQKSSTAKASDDIQFSGPIANRIIGVKEEKSHVCVYIKKNPASQVTLAEIESLIMTHKVSTGKESDWGPRFSTPPSSSSSNPTNRSSLNSSSSRSSSNRAPSNIEVVINKSPLTSGPDKVIAVAINNQPISPFVEKLCVDMKCQLASNKTLISSLEEQIKGLKSRNSMLKNDLQKARSDLDSHSLKFSLFDTQTATFQSRIAALEQDLRDVTNKSKERISLLEKNLRSRKYIESSPAAAAAVKLVEVEEEEVGE